MVFSICMCVEAKSLQSCLTFCDPMNHSPPGSSANGKNTGMGCHALLQGIFLTQGLNPRLLRLLHREGVSLPLATCVAGSMCVLQLKNFGQRFSMKKLGMRPWYSNLPLFAWGERDRSGCFLILSLVRWLQGTLKQPDICFWDLRGQRETSKEPEPAAR